MSDCYNLYSLHATQNHHLLVKIGQWQGNGWMNYSMPMLEIL